MKIAKRQLKRIIREAYGDWGEFKDPTDGTERIEPAVIETYLEGTLDSTGPTEAEHLAKTFEKHYGVPKEDTYALIDTYIEEGYLYMDIETGKVYLLPDHEHLIPQVN